MHNRTISRRTSRTIWRLGLGALLVLASTFVACTGARQRATEPPRAITGRNTGPALDAAFVLPATTLPSAPWLEAPLAPPKSCEVDMLLNVTENTAFDRPPYVDDSLSERHVVAANVDMAIVQTRRMTLAVSRTQGVLGSLSLPEDTRWIGLSALGNIFAATTDGTLYRSDPSPPLVFQRQANVPGATRWDSGGRVVAALANGRVMRSLDEGATFQEIPVDRDADIDELAVRFDGVMVVQGSRRSTGASDAWLARDGGAFQRSTFPVSSLYRSGGIIAGSDSRCPELAADGRTWIYGRWLTTWPDGPSDWPTRAFETSSRLTMLDNPPSFIELPRRPGPQDKVARANSARANRCEGSHKTRAPRIKLSADSTVPLHGAGAAAISGRLDRDAAPTNTDLVWLSDGRVDHETVARASHMAVLSRQPANLRIIVPPCSHGRLFSTGGIGLVICRSPSATAGTFVTTIDREGQAFAEGVLPFSDLDALTLASAPDGTLLFRSRWGDVDRQAFVRSPVALGSVNAWRSVALGNAVEVRVVEGAGLLLIETGHVPIPSTFTLTLDRPGERRELLRSIVVDGSLLDLYVNHGNLVARTKPLESHSERCQTVTESGRLE
jgi:hypothetical protein